MTDQTPTRGLTRAREILAKADDVPLTPESAQAIMTRAMLAQAIATVELASATQLGALAAVIETDMRAGVLTRDERDQITNTVRALLGLPDSTKGQ